jgi:hypothetical protein
MKLKTLKIEASTIWDALRKVKNPAGKKELDYVLAHHNEFPEMTHGNYYFFFGATDGEHVPYVYWFGGKFCQSGGWFDCGWRPNYRAVLRDLDVELDSALELNLENLLLDLEALVKKYKP